MSRARNSDLIGGTLGLTLAIAFWLAREGNWSFWSAVFPNVMIVVIAVLSVLLLVKGFVAPAMLPLFAEGDRGRMALTALLLMAWGFAFSWLGALASSAIAFVVLTTYLGRRHITPSLRGVLTLSVAIAIELIAFYLVFTRVLHVPLPRGLLF